MSSSLRLVRQIRLFSLSESCDSHPFAWYFSCCAMLLAWANYAQYQRLRPMYPNYDEYCSKEGGRMIDSKRQELADVLRYNNMVHSMRRDLGTRS